MLVDQEFFQRREEHTPDLPLPVDAVNGAGDRWMRFAQQREGSGEDEMNTRVGILPHFGPFQIPDQSLNGLRAETAQIGPDFGFQMVRICHSRRQR
ncbi:hypothetical protein QW131_04165 [Roseibium salinum]|nr:hypothetical protein [Roseibium salinum]